MKTHKRYGWVRQRPDIRDRKLSVAFAPADLPAKVDLTQTELMPPVYNQGDIGSCTANAIAAAVDYERAKQGLPFLTPSRLFIYANERLMEQTSLSEDSGAQIRDGIKSVGDSGVCSESTWSYSEDFSTKPSQAAYDEALKCKVSSYHAVNQTLLEIKQALASGLPVTCGITVYESFEWPSVTETGFVQMPKPKETSLGGHAILLVGYNEADKEFFGRNSWGCNWGQHGYFAIPYDYITNPNLASDFWVISKIETT